MALQQEDFGWIKRLTDRGRFGFNIGSPEGAKAEGAALTALMGIPGQIAGAMGNASVGFGQSLANMYGANAGALGNLATARANFAGNQAGANAMAEAARQGALGNMGVAALGAYGGAANSAMGAWAQNQQGYNRSLADMYMANQNAMAQLGATRNTSLAQLGSPYSQMGIGGVLAGALGSPASGGFQASGPGGAIASGSYSSPPAGGSSRGGDMRGAYAGIDSLRDSLNSPAYLDAMRGQMESGADRLDAQQYSSRGMPGQMLGQTLSGLMSLGRQGYDQLRGGMNQFYGNQPSYNDSDLFGSINSNFGGARGDLNAGFSGTQGALRGLFDDSVGKVIPDPLQDAKRKREVDMFNRRQGILDHIARTQEYTTLDSTGQPVSRGFGRPARVTGDTFTPHWSQDHFRQRLRFEDELYR